MVTDANFVVKKGLNVQDGDISIKGSNKELRFYEGSNYVGFEAPALSADKIWVLPSADGSTGQLLKTDGSGNLGWVTAGGASSLNDLSDVVISNTSNLGIGTDVFGSINTNNSTAVGYKAGEDLTTGSNNVLLGSNAGASLTIGQDNIAIGRNTMYQDTSSIHSIAIGSQTAEFTTGDRNISIGSYAGRYISGNYNINLGVNANDTGSNTGSGNVVIGHNTDLADDTTDRNLIIAGYDGTNTTTWITGNSSGVVNIPGSLTVAGSAVGGAPTTAQVVSALNADLGGNVTIGTQADDTATFTGAVVVGDGTQPISAGQLTVVQTDNDETGHTLLLMDNEDDATRGPVMTMYRNTASPAAGDRLGSIRFNGEDGAGFARDYAKIEGKSVAVGAGSHTGQLIFSTTIGANITDVISIDGTTGGAYGGLLYNQTGIKTLSNSVSATSTANDGYITLLEVPHATFKAVKASIHITDSSSNEVQTMDLICHYDGSAANYANYGIIYDGDAPIGDAEVDINSSNIRIRFQNTQGSTVNLAGSIHAVCHP